MHYQMFLDLVKKTGQIKSIEETEVIVEATFATLGERIGRSAIDKLRSQLPNEIKKFLSEQTTFAHFNLEEFYHRISARADLGYTDAVRLSRAVIFVTKESVTEGLLKQIFNELPGEFHELLGQTPLNPLSPTVGG